ncbi:hypothetical protein BS78_01G204700 [Paspalum vaginatum]|nr:hypothetical protein BS78_01G204700 [Paspalum vaginatum]
MALWGIDHRAIECSVGPWLRRRIDSTLVPHCNPSSRLRAEIDTRDC